MKHKLISPNTNFILTIIFFCLVKVGLQSSFGQQSKTDSLISELKTTKADTSRVNLFYMISDALYDEAKPDSAIKYARQGLDLSKQNDYKKGESKCLNALGLGYYQLGKFDTALVYFKERLKIVVKLQDSMGIAGVYDNIGAIQNHFGMSEIALELRINANKIYEALNKKIHLASGYVWIGNIYKEQGEYTVALNHYLKSLKIYQDENEEQYIAYSLVNISSIYRYLKQNDLAKEYAIEAKTIFEETKNPNGVGVSLHRLAKAYTQEGNYKNSIKYLKEAKTIFEKIPNTYYLAIVNNQLGANYFDLGNVEEALKYINYAHTAAQKIGDLSLISQIYRDIGSTYLKMLNYSKALEYIDKSKELSIMLKQKQAMLQLTKYYINVYSHLNQPDSVLKYFNSYQELSDSLFSEQNSRSIAEMQTKYDTEKKEKELEVSAIKIEKKKLQVTLLSILAFVLILSGIIIYILQRKKYQKNILLAKSSIEKNKLEDSEVKCRIRNTVSDKVTKSILKKLSNEIENEKCYLDKELTITSLASKLKTNRDYLSQIINEIYGKNFNEFINSHRIKESINILEKIVSGEIENWTMNVVAEKSGFKHTSTFNPAFKSITQISPGDYKKALKKM